MLGKEKGWTNYEKDREMDLRGSLYRKKVIYVKINNLLNKSDEAWEMVKEEKNPEQTEYIYIYIYIYIY